MTDFDRSITFILKWEGDLTSDTGGLTRWGISQKSYPDLDIANLTLEEAKAIYKKDYWDAMKCDTFMFPECMVIFDSAVNCGVTRTKLWVAESEQNGGWRNILLLRISHYTKLANDKKYKPYFLGWMNRVMDLYKTVNDNV